MFLLLILQKQSDTCIYDIVPGHEYSTLHINFMKRCNPIQYKAKLQKLTFKEKKNNKNAL